MTPWMTTIIASLIATAFSAIISGFIMTRINKKLDIRQQDALDKEKKRNQAISEYNMLILKGITASLSLAEATAEAVDKNGVPDEKRSQARAYAEGITHDLQEFMYRQGHENLT